MGNEDMRFRPHVRRDAGIAPSVVGVHSHRMQASGFVWRHGLIVTSDEGLAEDG